MNYIEEFDRSLNVDHRENIRHFWQKIETLRDRKAKPVRNIKMRERKVSVGGKRSA